MNKITKKIWKLSFVLAFVFAISHMDPSVVEAKEYKIEGVWKGKIDGTIYYLDVKQYDSKGDKYIGDIAVYEGVDNFKKLKVKEYVRYRKYKNKNYVNKFYVKGFGATMSVKVSSKKIKLKQLKGSIGGVKFNGTFKLVKRNSTRKFS